MNMIKVFDTSKIVNLLSGGYNEVFSKYFIVAAIPILIIALFNCFLGHKLFKVFVGITGIFIGAGVGVSICIGINMFMKKGMPGFGMIGISLILGALLFGLASFKFYKAGAFCMGLISGMILGVVVMKMLNQDEYVIAAVIGGLLMGLLAIDLYKHMIIILTSVNGALIGATCIAIITKNDDPVFILKLGVGLAIVGIIVQYIVSLVVRKNNEEDDEMEDFIDKKEEKSKIRIDNFKNKKEDKRHARIEKKKVEKKKTKKLMKKKNENSKSGLFLIDFFSNIAQFIKDKIVNYLNAEDIEDDEDFEDEETDDEVYEDIVVEERIQGTPFVKNTIIIKESTDHLDPMINVEKALEQTLEEITIPIFDIDDIGHKLEAELDNNREIQTDENLEDLIIKQTIQNIEI